MVSDLGVSLSCRFEYSGDRADLDAAIDAGQQAVAAAPPGHAHRAGYLMNLGNFLRARFNRNGDGADLDTAIDAGRQAVADTPPGHPNLAIYLSNLGVFIFARFEHSGDGADLDAAISYGRQAVDATAADHPNRAAYLSNLGRPLRARFERAGDSADLEAAIDCWQQASKVPTAIPSVRLAAARGWGASSADARRLHEAAEGYAAAVGLLPEVAWHGLDRTIREEQLAQWAGLAVDAAACAVLDRRPRLAVELLEQGRSVLWAQALNLRSDLARLAEKAPELAGTNASMVSARSSTPPYRRRHRSRPEPGGGSAPGMGRARHEDAAELRRRKAREWDNALAQVRALDGFERFLAATPYPELAAAGGDGPVVIVNASSHGCQALIMAPGTDDPQVIDLPGMTFDASVDHANKTLHALAGTTDPGRGFRERERERDRHTVLDMLDWLWDTVAAPVLTALGHTTPHNADDRWPRVWWCPTGPLTVLPIHAAGHHPRHHTATTTDSTDCVLNRVISSYTSTLTALARQPVTPGLVRQLAVGMPATPGQPPLPAVPAELQVLAHHFPPGQANQQLAELQATRANVLAAVADHAWLHLACHAGQATRRPRP